LQHPRLRADLREEILRVPDPELQAKDLRDGDLLISSRAAQVDKAIPYVYDAKEMSNGIDWKIVLGAVWSLALLFIGAWVNRRYERRAKLISYFGHVSSFQTTPPGGAPLVVNAHSVILQNAGRKTATNIRLGHSYLPDFVIFPRVQYTIQPLPAGGREIVIPALVPKEQITISYLYFPPVTFEQVNSGIKFDDGFAQQIPVLLQRQFPKWINILVGTLMLIGTTTILYFVYQALIVLAHWWR
jgi:hypothetical protein